MTDGEYDWAQQAEPESAQVDHRFRWHDTIAWPAARDAFAIFDDLCLLGNGDHPQYLQLEYLRIIFAVRLIESVLTNYHKSSTRCVSLLVHAHTSCPPITVIYKACRALALSTTPSSHCPSERSAFPLTLRATHIIVLVLKQSRLNLRQTSRSFSRCLSNSSARRRGCWDSAILDESARNGDHAGDAFSLSIIVPCQVYMMLEAQVVRAR